MYKNTKLSIRYVHHVDFSIIFDFEIQFLTFDRRSYEIQDIEPQGVGRNSECVELETFNTQLTLRLDSESRFWISTLIYFHAQSLTFVSPWFE